MHRLTATLAALLTLACFDSDEVPLPDESTDTGTTGEVAAGPDIPDESTQFGGLWQPCPAIGCAGGLACLVPLEGHSICAPTIGEWVSDGDACPETHAPPLLTADVFVVALDGLCQPLCTVEPAETWCDAAGSLPCAAGVCAWAD